MASTTPSEFRKWVDNNDQPIRQSTKFRRIPLTIGLKYYLTDRGRSVSQFAYIPSKVAPYVGVGVGGMYYRFSQDGDFVDFNTTDLEVFSATIEDSGWTPTANGTLGFDYTIGPWLALSTQGRYQWAKARLDPDQFQGYEKIDLTGFAGTLGFRVRF
jgi:outer membrane protein W